MQGGLNTYDYVSGNPLYWIDSLGLNPASSIANSSLNDGVLTLAEANSIWRNNTEGTNFAITYDASNITLELTSSFNNSIATATVIANGDIFSHGNDFLVHGNVAVSNNNGEISIITETYDFLPNNRESYPSSEHLISTYISPP